MLFLNVESAVRDFRAQLKPPSMQAPKLLLDPAIHEEFTRLKNLVEEKDKKVKELHDNIAAVNFTPQSKMGKMLMAKCRTLQEENEEIGNQANEGKGVNDFLGSLKYDGCFKGDKCEMLQKFCFFPYLHIHELTMKLALQRSQNAELISQFEGLCKQMEALTNDVERSNEMVLILQDKVAEKDEEISKLNEKNTIVEKTELTPGKTANDEETTTTEAQAENE